MEHQTQPDHHSLQQHHVNLQTLLINHQCPATLTKTTDHCHANTRQPHFHVTTKVHSNLHYTSTWRYASATYTLQHFTITHRNITICNTGNDTRQRGQQSTPHLPLQQATTTRTATATSSLNTTTNQTNCNYHQQCQLQLQHCPHHPCLSAAAAHLAVTTLTVCLFVGSSISRLPEVSRLKLPRPSHEAFPQQY